MLATVLNVSSSRRSSNPKGHKVHGIPISTSADRGSLARGVTFSYLTGEKTNSL